MLSCLHGLYDDRIYWKEGVSLQRNGYSVTHIGIGNQNKTWLSKEGITLIEIVRKRYFANSFTDKIFRIITFRPNIYNKIFRIAALQKADIYHFHDLQLNRIGPELKRLPHLPKVIYDVHEPYPVTISNIKTRWLITSLFFNLFGKYIKYWENKKVREYDKIITTEEIVNSRFEGLLGKGKSEIIYNYTNLEPSSDINQEKEYDLIYAGSIRSIRSVMEILEAIRIITETGGKVKMLFIGVIHESWLKQKMELFISENSLQNNITIHPFVPYSEINDYYRKSRIGLLIFHDLPVHHIILPIKLFEYMTFGLPVIGNDFGHVSDFITKEECGITVSSPDPKLISEAIIKLLENKEEYERLSSNGKNAALKYTWQKMEIRLLRIYSDLLDT